jgi:hypothetical protein
VNRASDGAGRGGDRFYPDYLGSAISEGLRFRSLARMMHGMEPSTGQQPPTGTRHVHQTLVPALEAADAFVYALVGIVFLFAALGMLGYSLVAFPSNLHDTGFALAIVTLVNDLLLVMISATRRILAIGAQMSVTGDTLSSAKFREVIIDLGANAGAILAIAVALYLLARRPTNE